MLLVLLEHHWSTTRVHFYTTLLYHYYYDYDYYYYYYYYYYCYQSTTGVLPECYESTASTANFLEINSG